MIRIAAFDKNRFIILLLIKSFNQIYLVNTIKHIKHIWKKVKSWRQVLSWRQVSKPVPILSIATERRGTLCKLFETGYMYRGNYSEDNQI
jgi:hypothetical protein